jgi:hypothetical protein
MRCLTCVFSIALVACGGGESTPSPDTTPDASDTSAPPDSVEDSLPDAEPEHRCLAWSAERLPLFGDLHVHTRLSLDANLQGTRLSPADAYRFARGEEVGIQPHDADGAPLRRLRLERPLDFAAVTDHAEFIGAVSVCTTPGLEGYDHAECVQYRDNPDLAFVRLNIYVAASQDAVSEPALCGDGGAACRAPKEAAWNEIREAARAALDETEACGFTSLVGYEWSGAPAGANLHRNVIFASDAVPELPFSYFDEPYPEGLWARLAEACGAIPGCDVLAIPHNSNLSSGLMFAAKKQDGSPIDRDFALRQAAMEPLIEIMQHKGDSECLPGTPIADEYCDFEKVPYDSLATANLELERDPKPRDFVRDALLRGLELERDIGVNPWRFGIIASTDTHLGTPGAVSESGYPGHGGAGAAARDTLPVGLVDQIAFNPGGLVGVWAEENAREAIFAALRRKETWGTSGPRITVRFFGGDVDAALCDDPELADKAYAAAVPMGGALGARSGAPRFLIAAQRDPGTAGEPSAPLAVVQIVKGWVDAEGKLLTRVVDVAGGDAGEPDPDTATCDVPKGGFDRLCGVFEDDGFEAGVPAFWYARVIERPTCRWSTRQCLAAGIDCAAAVPVPEGYAACCEGKVDPLVRERAWTSPIWWQP